MQVLCALETKFWSMTVSDDQKKNDHNNSNYYYDYVYNCNNHYYSCLYLLQLCCSWLCCWMITIICL